MKKALQSGLTEGEAKGRAEGEAKKQNEIARNLKAQGISFDVIVAATGLSKEEIEAL